MKKIIKYRIINVVCCVGSVQIHIEKKKVGVLPIQIVKSNVSSVGPSSEGNMTERKARVGAQREHRVKTEHERRE